MTYTWLLFDADGTLFDYDRAEATALEQDFHGSRRRIRAGRKRHAQNRQSDLLKTRVRTLRPYRY